MTDKTIAFGCDHAGVGLKEQLIEIAQSFGYRILNCGANTDESVDYPDFADKVVNVIESGQASLGVLVCGTGIGMSMAANRHPGIRAAVCHTELEARLAREHNNANILCVGARILGIDQAKSCLAAFLNASFQNGRHTQRVAKMGIILT
jgi:ribose 5-phosphate isomerase B